MATQKTIEIVKSTAPVLKEHGVTITKVMYKNLFEKYPEMMNLFNMTRQKKGDQPKALANAVFQYATHIDQLEKLGPAVELIAQKHTAFSISKEHYPIVGQTLLNAIKEVLGDAASPEIMDAWAEAYQDLAVIFINREEELYSEKENYVGGFRGFKEFVVADKIQESDIITSFYFKRKDGNPVPEFMPGQFIGISLSIQGKDHKDARNYSMSDSPSNDHLRISVKKEPGNPDGVVSNYLHSSVSIGDTVLLTMPAGNFVLKDNNKPLVLLSGGVGITPLLSMFKKAVKETERPIYFIQCAQNSKVRAFKDEIESEVNDKVKSIVVYSLPTESDKSHKNFDYEGYLTKDILEEANIPVDSEFYLCGPKPFMVNAFQILKDYNINKEAIFYEFFGTSEFLD